MKSQSHVGLPLSVAPALPAHEPDLVPAHKEAILSAVKWAWSELTTCCPDLLRAGDEELITERLESLLNERRADGTRRAPGLADFETVVRGASQRTADGRIQKKPDLTFRPPLYRAVTNATRWGWFVECKILDGQRSVRAYADHGIQRFALGEYAAWMQSGAMLGYVRDGRGPLVTLQCVDAPWASALRPGPSDDRCETHHGRAACSPPCVDVALSHLWLTVP